MFSPSLRGHARLSLLESVSFILVALSVLVKLACIVALRWQHLSSKDYSYIGDDYPERWNIDRPYVRMASDTTIRFDMFSTEGIAEWRAMVPGDGLIHLGPEQQPYTVSMLHQLRCLDVIRDEVVQSMNRTGPPSRLGRHCMNYMRQMVMCRGVAHLETFEVTNHTAPVDLHAEYECRDWGAVYREVEVNQLKYAEWKRGRVGL